MQRLESDHGLEQLCVHGARGCSEGGCVTNSGDQAGEQVKKPGSKRVCNGHL